MLTHKWLLPGDDLEDAFSVRIRVFVEEQGFSRELELDDIDPTAHHLVYYNQTGQPVATGRMFPHEQQEGTLVIGRVAVDRSQRGTGLGREMMLEMERKARELGIKRLELGAQCQAQGFYQKLGYTPFGETYLDEHCPHIHMERVLSTNLLSNSG